MPEINERIRRNREELQTQFDDAVGMLGGGWEWEPEDVERIEITSCLDMVNTLERIMLYKQAGWI